MTKNRRACWNCDASVHIHNTKCPYCGADLTEEAGATVPPPPYGQPLEQPLVQASAQTEELELAMASQVISEPSPTLEPEQLVEPEPVLRQVTPQRAMEPEGPFLNPEPVAYQQIQEPVRESPKPAKPVAHRPISMRGIVLPMLMLLPGAFFLLFSAILVLFSSDGTLTLRWNAHYWVLYLGLALPLLYFGWRAMNQADTETERPQEIEFRD